MKKKIFILILFITNILNISCNKNNNEYPLYVPVFYMRNIGNIRKLMYFDIENKKMMPYRDIELILTDRQDIELAISENGEYLAVHYLADIHSTYKGFEIINLNNGKRCRIDLDYTEFCLNNGVFMGNKYIFPLVKLKESEAKISISDGSRVYYENSKFYNKSSREYSYIISFDVNTGTKLEIVNNYLDYEVETYMGAGIDIRNYDLINNEILLIYDNGENIYIYNINNSKFRKHNPGHDGDILIGAYNKIYKNDELDENVICKNSRFQRLYFESIDPSNQYCMAINTRRSKYQKGFWNIYNIRSGRVTRIESCDISLINSMSPSQMNSNPEAGFYEFVGWVKMENLQQTAPK